jgi:hypothetical protein
MEKKGRTKSICPLVRLGRIPDPVFKFAGYGTGTGHHSMA